MFYRHDSFLCFFVLALSLVSTLPAATGRVIPAADLAGPAFGSYTVPADGELYSFPMHDVSHAQVWARYTGGLDGVLHIRLTRDDGDQLAAIERHLLWTWDTKEHLRSKDIVFFRPVSRSKVTCRIVIETLDPEKSVRFGIYRPTEVQLEMEPIRKAVGGYRIGEDYSEDLHPKRSHILPAHLRMDGLRGGFTPFHNVVKMGELADFDFGHDAVRWADGRYELWRWSYEERQRRRTPEWGYIVFDHQRGKWWRLCAFRRVRTDALPTAWLFDDNLLAVVNGFCSNLRLYRLTEGGVENFALPTREIAGHMKKLARLFYRDRGNAAVATIAVTDVARRGPYKRDIDLTLRLTLRSGDTYRLEYQITRGKLTASTTTRLDLQTEAAL